MAPPEKHTEREIEGVLNTLWATVASASRQALPGVRAARVANR